MIKWRVFKNLQTGNKKARRVREHNVDWKEGGRGAMISDEGVYKLSIRVYDPLLNLETSLTTP